MDAARTIVNQVGESTVKREKYSVADVVDVYVDLAQESHCVGF
jgi:hypothetical protein